MQEAEIHSIVTIKLSNEESKFTKKFNCYTPFTVSPQDSTLGLMVKETIAETKFTPSEVDVTVKFFLDRIPSDAA